MCHFIYKNIYRNFRVIILGLLIVPPANLLAQGDRDVGKNINPPFNINEIIEKVSSQRTTELPCDSLTVYTGNIMMSEYEQKSESSRTGEFLIDTNIVYVPTRKDQYSPSIAFDGTNYLIVWHDTRCGTGYSDIYGTRVSPAGTVLDPVGIAISTAGGSQAFPSVAFNGINYFVVWGNCGAIYGARVSPAGTVLDTAGIAISTTAYEQELPSVAFDGINYLVVWLNQDHWNIYGARVNPMGTVLDTAGIAISTAANDQKSPSVAFDGTNYLVVWEDTRSGSSSDIYGTRVSPAGTVLDTAGIVISTAANGQYSSSVAFDGTNYLVVWDDQRSGSSSDIYGARVSPAGTVLDPAGIAISTAAYYQWSPSVAFDGTNYLVGWHDNRNVSYPGTDIYGARVSPTGTVLDPAGIAISTAANNQSLSSVAFDGTNYLVVWDDQRSGSSSDIYGARMNTAGTVLDTTGIAISTTAHDQYSSSVAFDGTNYFVVWEDKRNVSSFSDIYGARVNPAGTVLDTTGIAISTAPYDQYCPSVAYDGTNNFVVWEDKRNGHTDIYGARVSPAGTVLDTSGIAISTAPYYQCSPSVAFDGTNYLVIWEDTRSGYSDIYGARVSPAGTVLDPAGIAISTAAYGQWRVSVAYDGINYLVVWEDGRPYTYSDIYGARVSPAGTVLDPAGIAISTAAFHQDSPSVAFDGTNYLVVWNDNRTSSTMDIYGARVSPAGTVLDPAGIVISTAIFKQYNPSVAFDGTNYFVVWEDCPYANGYYDLYGARLSPAGTIIDQFAVSTQIGNQNTPALVHGSGDQLLITYSGYIDYINGHPAYTMRIWGKFYPFVGIEEEEAKSVSRSYLSSTIFSGHLKLPEGKKCRVFDIAGRKVELTRMGPGVYFVEIDGVITSKMVKVR